MRTRPSTLAVSLALIASAQFTIFASPAFAQGGAQEAPAADAKPIDPKPSDAESKPEGAKPEGAKPEGTTDDAAMTDTAKTEAVPVVPATMPADTVEVSIDSPVPVSLERRDGDVPWEFVCNSPCNQRVALGAQYRVVGENLNGSKPFALDSAVGDKITLTVSPGNHKKAVQGMWVLGGSAVLATAGLIVILAGSDGGTTFNGDNETHNGNTNFIFAGTALILAGVAGGFVGGAWLLDNYRTGVSGDVRTAPVIHEKSSPSGVEVSTTSRAPVFNAPKTAGLPSVMSVPLWQGTF